MLGDIASIATLILFVIYFIGRTIVIFNVKPINYELLETESPVYSDKQRQVVETCCLDDDLLKELIERIEVCHIEGVGKNRTQHFKIHYKFIGCIALPEVPKPRPVKLNTRQGVAVEYLPSAI